MEGSWEFEYGGSQYLIDNDTNKKFSDCVILLNTLVNIAHLSLEAGFCGQFASSRTAGGKKARNPCVHV